MGFTSREGKTRGEDREKRGHQKRRTIRFVETGREIGKANPVWPRATKRKL